MNSIDLEDNDLTDLIEECEQFKTKKNFNQVSNSSRKSSATNHSAANSIPAATKSSTLHEFDRTIHL